jgi:hypothetical protein
MFFQNCKRQIIFRIWSLVPSPWMRIKKTTMVHDGSMGTMNTPQWTDLYIYSQCIIYSFDDCIWVARVFSKLSCPGQTRTRVEWELTGYYRKIWTSSKSMRVDESWLDIIARGAKTLINSYQNVEPAQKLIGWELERERELQLTLILAWLGL